MWTHVDRGEGEGLTKRDFFVDVINGWPHTTLATTYEPWLIQCLFYINYDAVFGTFCTLCCLLSYPPIFLRPYHFLKLVSFLGSNRTKSASVCPWLWRGAI